MYWSHDSEIVHDAIVQNSDNQSVTVLLSGNGSCSGCDAEKTCGASGNDRKEVVIKGNYDLRPGSNVTVIMKQSAGFLALFLGYLLPLLLFLICMIILNSFSVNELLSGLISLGSLIPYYLLLTLFRKSINRKFSFTLKI
jgi:positive regulator of sigma E activity